MMAGESSGGLLVEKSRFSAKLSSDSGNYAGLGNMGEDLSKTCSSISSRLGRVRDGQIPMWAAL